MYFQGPVYQIKEAVLYFGTHQYENIHTLVSSKLIASNHQNCYILKKTHQLKKLIEINEYINSQLNENRNVQLLFQQDEEQYFFFLLFGFLISQQISLEVLIELYGFTKYVENLSQYLYVLEEYEDIIQKKNKVESIISENPNRSYVMATSQFSEQPLFSRILIEQQKYSQIFDQNHQFESVILSQGNKQIDIQVNDEEEIQNPNISLGRKRTY